MLHGAITGLQRIRTLETADDGLHRLLVSFKDAKVLNLYIIARRYSFMQSNTLSLADVTAGMVSRVARSRSDVAPHLRASPTDC